MPKKKASKKKNYIKGTDIKLLSRKKIIGGNYTADSILKKCSSSSPYVVVIASLLVSILLVVSLIYPAFLKSRAAASYFLFSQSARRWSGSDSTDHVPFYALRRWSDYTSISNLDRSAGYGLQSYDDGTNGNFQSSVFDLGNPVNDLFVKFYMDPSNTVADSVTMGIEYSTDGNSWVPGDSCVGMIGFDGSNASCIFNSPARYIRYSLDFPSLSSGEVFILKELIFMTHSPVVTNLYMGPGGITPGSNSSDDGSITLDITQDVIDELNSIGEPIIGMRTLSSVDPQISIPDFTPLAEYTIYMAPDSSSMLADKNGLSNNYDITFNFPSNPGYRDLAVYQDFTFINDFGTVPPNHYYDSSTPGVTITPTSFTFPSDGFFGNFILGAKPTTPNVPTPDINGNLDFSAIPLSDMSGGTVTINGVQLGKFHPFVIGDQSVEINSYITVQNGGSDLNISANGISIIIPDGTTIYTNESWSNMVGFAGVLEAPQSLTNFSGTPPLGFNIGDVGIEFGSSLANMVFDHPITIVIPGIAGVGIGYKPVGSSNWYQITDVCEGTYNSPSMPSSPTNPPGECAIDDLIGNNKKILTYHATEFATLLSGPTPAAVGSPSYTPEQLEPVSQELKDKPSETSITINSDAGRTNSRNVTLTLGADDATEMMISNDLSFAGASWETYKTSKPWTLTEGDGTKTVYAKFRNGPGNESTYIYRMIILENQTASITPSPEQPSGWGAKSKAQTYIVQSGDYLIKIAQKVYNDAQKWWNLVTLNKNSFPIIQYPPYTIYPGWELKY